ncbi:MAG: acyl-CoA desaturase [Nitrospina sp.]|nr:acyl-CoA desaturase [Nitrospina sp.]MBT6854451.1 acyl-CoA desaturase [Nitrospina sp.]MBT7475874.1 acyl-CoA desaturase [Nitrospina sp.]MBT7935248.1 acyl-CoA desaturase [Nitrospina sp.]
MTSESTEKYQLKFNPIATAVLVSVHLMALLAFFPFAFSWSAVAVMFFLYWLTASLGICLGYHRYLTHRGFTAPTWLGYTLIFFGTLACQNGPIKWVGQHRMHHAGSDTPEDPHSAKKGFWWAHLNWMFNTHSKFDDKQVLRDYTKDFCEDKFYKFLDDYFVLVQVAFGLILLAIGGLPWVIWGVFVRLVVTYHSTWLVNSAAHWYGYVTFPLKDDLSTNCWWVGLLAFGEGWHNNHHAFPKSARHGLRPWEIDMTWWALCVLEKLGLAKDIKVAQLTPNPDRDEKEAPAFIGKVVTQTA